MHWVLILAVLTATTLAENAPSTPADHPALKTVLALVAMLLAPALAGGLSAVVVRGIERDRGEGATWLARFTLAQQLHSLLWLGLVAAITWGLDWPQLVRVNLGLGAWILVDDLLVLLPVYLPLMLSWAAFYDVDRAVYTRAADLADVESDEPTQRLGRMRYVLLHARHYLGLVMAPLVALYAFYDVVRWAAPDFLDGPYAWLLLVPLVLLAIVSLPQAISLVWRTETLPRGPLRDRLEQVLADCRLQVRDVLLWRTEGRMANAAVSGVCARVRYLFLTDRLLEQLNREEIAAVVRHEAGHIVHHHLALRMLMLGVPLAAWGAIEQAAPELIAVASEQLTALGVSPLLQNLIAPGLIAIYGIVGLGRFCRHLEYEADLFACGLLEKDKPRADCHELTSWYIAALRAIAIETGGEVNRDGWLHPSIARRVRLVRRALVDPELAQSVRRRTRRAAWLIAAAYLACLVALASSL